MDFGYIEQFMKLNRFTYDPAFDKVSITIQPLPCFDDICPLGLYDPNIGLIAIPPDCSDAVLLHELGHRHGHFYYNNLTEEYAERWRMNHQKGSALLYHGTDVGVLPKLEKLFREKESGAVVIPLQHSATTQALREFKQQICNRELPPGESPPRFFYHEGEEPFIRIEFTKGIAWLPIIASVMVASGGIVLGVLGYGVYKTADSYPWILPLAAVSVSSFFIFRAVLNDMKKRGVA